MMKIETLDHERQAAQHERILELLRIAGHMARLGGWRMQLSETSITWSDEICVIHEVPQGHMPTEEEAHAFFLPKYRNSVRTLVEDCRHGGTPFDFEGQILTAGSQVLWVRYMGQCERNAEGNIVGIQGAFQDITERREAEEAVRSSEANFRTLVNSSWDVFHLIGADGTILFESPAVTRVLGYDPEEMIGLNALEFVHPDDLSVVTGTASQLLSAPGSQRTIILRVRHKNGSWRWMESFEVNLLDNPAVRGIAVNYRDITERREAEAQLQANEQRFRSMANSISQLAWIARADGAIFWYNQRWYDYTGTTPEQMEGWGWQSVHDPDCLPLVLEQWTKAIATGTEVEMEFPLRGADGTFRNFLTRVMPVRDAGGTVVQWVGTNTDVDALKRTERLLRVSEAGLTRAQKIARMGSWHWNLITGELQWSKQVSELFGMEPAAFCGEYEGFLKAMHPADRESVHQAVMNAVAGIRPYDLEHRAVWPDGTVHIMHQQGEVTRDDDGRVLCLTATIQDITERKRIELALEETHRALQMVSRCREALNRSATETALLEGVCKVAVEVGGYRLAWVGYALHDEQKTIAPQACAGASDGYLTRISVTWSAEKITGNGPAGRVIRSGAPVVFTDLDSPEPAAPRLSLALERGFRGVIALPLRDASGTYGVLVLYSSEVRTPNPDELRLLQELADDMAYGIAAHRMRVERDLAQENIARQAALLDNATDAIYVCDLGHRITYWNNGAERVYGWSASEAVGQSIVALQHRANAAAAFYQAMEQLLAMGKWSGELEKMTKSGACLTVQCRWTLVRDDAGSPKAVLAINTDITERRALEQQFMRVQRMESIGTLAGGIAHDLNNVLAPIMMSIELLRLQEQDSRRREILSTIESSARRGAGMVRQVLSFARGVAGQKSELQVQPLVKEVEKICNDTFLKNIEVRSQVEPKLWNVRGDVTQLHQVLINLSVNARDAMPLGGSLTVSAYNVMLDEQYVSTNIDARQGPHVVIEVTDTGAGMPPDVVDRIFEPFYTTKEFGNGTGLGLSTTLAIIKGHGGFISVQSQPGEGSKFRVYLPAMPNSGKTKAASTASPTSPQLPRGCGEMVLVIDDEAAIREVTRQTLEAFGYRVVVAGDGGDGVAVYASRKDEIAVVLTDMMMPVMDGLATIQVLVRLNPQVRIIAASGLSTTEMAAQATQAGAKHFIPKPYTAETLLTTLRKAQAEEV